MEKPRKSFALWITGHILRGLAVTVVFAICALLLWRVFIASRVPGELRRLSPNAPLAEAYAASDELTLFTQEQATVTRGENNPGYFGVPRFTFIKEARQVQVIFRYNNGTLKKVAEDLSLGSALPRGEQVFDLSLLVMRDLTPEDTADNVDGSESIGTERISPTACEVSTTLLYTYYRLTFDGVDVGEDALTVFLDVYFGEAPDYSAAPLGTLRLYHNESENLYQSLSRKEAKALEAFAK